MNDDLMPAYGSEDWNDYVMTKFNKSELFDGNPTCAGLRRVAEELLGTIVVSRPAQVWPATDSNGPGRARPMAPPGPVGRYPPVIGLKV